MVEGGRRQRPKDELTNRLLTLCFAVALVINVGYTLIGPASIPAKSLVPSVELTARPMASMTQDR